MTGHLQILHYNVGRQRQVQWSMLNDEAYSQFAVIAVVEPHMYTDRCTGEVRCGSHNRWRSLTPTSPREHGPSQFAYRAMLWVSTDTVAVQIPAQSHDIVAAVVRTVGSAVLVISAYDPNEGDSRIEKRRAIDQKMACVREVIDDARRIYGDEIEMVICSDFNRHHTLWGGSNVVARRKTEGAPIVELAHEFGLQSMLPAGTITWQHIGKQLYTTVDVILASAGVADQLVRCGVDEHDHGSDHRPISIEFNIPPQHRPHKPSRLLPEKADWFQIGTEIESRLQTVQLPQRATSENLDNTADRVMEAIVDVVHNRVPRARPSPHAKRWWTSELTLLRKTMSSSRNFIVTLRRRGEDTAEAMQSYRRIRQRYFDEIVKQKKQHWNVFLADPNNIWKANAYARNASQSMEVPTLVNQGTTAETDEAKADMLMATFFPIPPEPRLVQCDDSAPARRAEVPHELPRLAAEEIRQAIFRQNPTKAPGADEITFEMWRRLLDYVMPWVQWMYQASLDLGYVPKSWRTAKIVTLKKPGKSDYTVPKTYRPISLLPTISKGLEAIVATRLSYLAERYSLLPTNHFGARKQRSCEQALDVLIEKIFEAWKGKRILSLVTFDVQGAFNGVHAGVLERRLRERSIPDKMTRWIRSFCEERKGSVVVGNYTSDCMPIGHAGIPQGSPLSPILYIFYNANLVESRIGKGGGSIGFIDDFTAWRTGPTCSETTARLQAEVLGPAARWSEESGATFEASKTGFIHFERRPGTPETRPALQFFDSVIEPQSNLKILGVVLDTKLGMTAHTDKTITAATKKCLAIGRLRGIRPKQMRQLHRAVIDSTTDYAASTWYARGKLGVQQHTTRLDRIQRMGAQAIIGAFRTVSSGVLQVEAGLDAVETRLARRTAKHALGVRALPPQHPLWSIMNDMEFRNDRCRSPMFDIWSTYYKVIQNKKGVGVTPRLPYTLPPWHDLHDWVHIHDEAEARRVHRRVLSAASQHQLYYTDASVRNGWAGIAVVGCSSESGRRRYKLLQSEVIGRATTCTVTSAEVGAIKAALEHIRHTKKPKQAWIISDSQEALQRLQGGGKSKMSREIVAATLREVQLLREKGKEVRLLWIPGHAGLPGNERAHHEAQKMTEAHRSPCVHPERRIREHSEVLKLLQAAVEADIPKAAAKWGKYTYSIDCALPGRHTLQLYGALTREEAGILAQARTGHTHLRAYLARTHQIDSAICKCECGAETVKHVILHCPLWASQRRQLQDAAGERWGDVSFLLGGKSRKIDPKTGKPMDGNKWRPNMEVVRATVAFLQSTGRFAAQAGTPHHQQYSHGVATPITLA